MTDLVRNPPPCALRLREPRLSRSRSDQLARSWLLWLPQPRKADRSDTKLASQPPLPTLEFEQAGVLLAACPAPNFDPLCKWELSHESLLALACQAPVQLLKSDMKVIVSGDTSLAHAILSRLPYETQVPALVHASPTLSLISDLSLTLQPSCRTTDLERRLVGLSQTLQTKPPHKNLAELESKVTGLSMSTLRQRRRRARARALSDD